MEFIPLNVEDSQKFRLELVDDAAVKEEGPEAVEIIPVGDDLCLVSTMSSSKVNLLHNLVRLKNVT